jgi:hypothetical protein
MKKLFSIAALCAFVAFALQLNGAEPPATKANVKHRPFSGTIKAVSAASRAIVLRGEKAQTFFIIPETKIKRDGQPIKFEQITAGETLGGYARQAPDGRWEALTLNFGEKKKDAQPAPKPQTNAPLPRVRR